MAVPIETFEHNIAEEIRNKEASLTDIASATDETKKVDAAQQQEEKHTSHLFMIASVLILCAVIGIVSLGYLYAVGKFDPFRPTEQELAAEKEKQLRPTTSLSSISPTLNTALGRYVARVEKSNKGVVLYLNAYPPVFTYMLKNESSYADELSAAIGVARETKGVKRDTVTVATSSTVVDGTTTLVTSVSTSTEVYFAPPFAFNDITVSNQNMRIATSGSSTVVYAFLGDRALLISTSTQGILSLRSSTLNAK